ncbi:hypothetical protein F5Y16DRAFT_402233 [Xylariaceae sp. FL0255]|nr:hypothetical protein F5Y16DRAFT_402233 [Xylariaceae sp. FL0255]
MDPLTAVGLAGNIFQFISFVGDLLNNTRKLYASATGTSSANDHFQDICGTLIKFNEDLRQPPSGADQLSKYGKALAQCAAACKQECEDLLRIMNKLRTIATTGPRYWNSFRAALTEVWKHDDIEDLRSRIADCQRQMNLLLCAASNESIQKLESHVRDLGRGIWNLHTDSRMDKVLHEIRHLNMRVQSYENGGWQDTASGAKSGRNICKDFSRLSLETQIFEKEAQILATLNYSDRTVRHDKIPDAHDKTFKWGLQQSKVKYSKLRNWLTTDEALFWVSGKPGSGNSTFMKSIADNEETKRCLEAWAGKHQLIVVSHYFTIYGTSIQRSLEGLLRSLAFGILSMKPALIKRLLVDRWDKASERAPWTQSELETLLRRLGTEIDGLPSKLCYFIDGLDEFDGDHLDICQTLRRMSQSPFIKVCVSSRPWNVFEDGLGDKPNSKLYMHELTQGDIHNYTETRLQEHVRWNVLQEEAGIASSRSLIDEIVSKSNGVFLWVTLVVDQLREGLTNDDSLFDLRRRLDSFPSDLEEFFKHILKTVDPFYNERMAATLSIALEALEPLSLEVYSFHDLEYANEDYASAEPEDLITTDLAGLNKLFNSVSRRINGRCKGLLERNGDRMEFLHRTVYDFLRTSEMSKFLKDQAKSSHNPSLSILMAFVAWIKRSKFACTKFKDPLSQINSFVERLRQSLPYARLADIQGASSAALVAELLDNLEQSITRMLSRGQIEMVDSWRAIPIFRRLVLEAGVGGYIRRKLSADPDFLTDHQAGELQTIVFLVCNPSCKLTLEDRNWVLDKLKADDKARLRARECFFGPRLMAANDDDYQTMYSGKLDVSKEYYKSVCRNQQAVIRKRNMIDLKKRHAEDQPEAWGAEKKRIKPEMVKQ